MSFTYEQQASLIVGDVITAFTAGYATAWAADPQPPHTIPAAPNWFASHDDYFQFFSRLYKGTLYGLMTGRQTYQGWASGGAGRSTVLLVARVHGGEAYKKARGQQLLLGLRWVHEILPTLDAVAQTHCPGAGQGGGWVCGN